MAQHPSITEPVMTHARVAILVLVAALAGCRENPLISEPNDRPTAVARVVLPTGPADETTFPGTEPNQGQGALQFAFDGTPLEIKLDGLASSDKDGRIVKYNWQSATPVGDGGTADSNDPLWMPPGSNAGWPDDEAAPSVVISAAGVYSFNLWVTDDRGAVSVPDTIKFTVGEAVDPAVAACMPTVAPSVPAECSECLCGISDQCRNDVKESSCNEACWTFLRCLGTKCPNFRMMAMQMPPDYSCLTTNCMAEYMAGMTGATPAGACVTMCGDVCRSMPTMM